jgi:hypothetical protein
MKDTIRGVLLFRAAGVRALKMFEYPNPKGVSEQFTFRLHCRTLGHPCPAQLEKHHSQS